MACLQKATGPMVTGNFGSDDPDLHRPRWLEVLGSLPAGETGFGNYARTDVHVVTELPPDKGWEFRYSPQNHIACVKFDLKWDAPTVVFPPEELGGEDALAFATEVALAAFPPHLFGHCRVYEFGECADRMPKNTSSGEPYRRVARTKWEAWIRFGNVAPQRLWNEMEAYAMSDFHPDVRPFVLWKSFPKDELLPLEKINANRCRGIVSPPLDFLLCMMRLTQDFNSRLKAHYMDTPSKLGMGFAHGGMDGLVAYLQSAASEVVRFEERDVSSYDSRMPQFLLKRWIPELRLRYMTRQHAEDCGGVMRAVYDEIARSRILAVDGTVFQKQQGQPSGSPCTTEDNILAHIAIIAMGYYRTCRNIGRQPLATDLLRHIKWGIYGDDCIAGIGRELAFYTMEEQALAFELLGMSVPVEKRKVVEVCPPSCVKKHDHISGPDGLSFLGNTFRRHRRNGMYVPVGKEEHAWSSLRFPLRNCRDIADSAERVIGIWITYFYCRWVCDWCEEWIHRHRYELARIHEGLRELDLIGEFNLPGVPTREWIDALWTGEEAVGARGDCRILKLLTMSGKQSKQQKKQAGKKGRNGFIPAKGRQSKVQIVYVPRPVRQPVKKKLDVRVGRVPGGYTSNTRAASYRALPDGSLSVSGCELVGTISTTGVPTQGDVLYSLALAGVTRSLTLEATKPLFSLWNVPISGGMGPSADNPATRIGWLMQGWSKFAFIKAHLRFVPSVAFTQAGTITMVAWEDPAEPLPAVAGATIDNWRRATQCQFHTQGSVTQQLTLRAPLERPGVHYYVDRRGAQSSLSEADVRQYAAGAFQVVAGSNMAANTSYGNLYLDYEVHLIGPELPSMLNGSESSDSEAVALKMGVNIFDGVTSTPIAPALGNMVLSTTQYDLPDWINAAGQIIRAGMYLYDIGATIPTNGTGAIQLNSTNVYNAALGNLFTALSGGSELALNQTVTGPAYQSTSSKRVVFNVTDQQIATGGGVFNLPGFINTSVGKLGNLTGATGDTLSAVAVMLARLSNPVAMLRTRARAVESDERMDLVVDWLTMFPDERLWGPRLFTVAGTDEPVWDVSWSELEGVLISDIDNGVPTAQGLFGGASSSGTRDEDFELVEVDVVVPRRISAFGSPTTGTLVRKVGASTPR